MKKQKLILIFLLIFCTLNLGCYSNIHKENNSTEKTMTNNNLKKVGNYGTKAEKNINENISKETSTNNPDPSDKETMKENIDIQINSTKKTNDNKRLEIKESEIPAIKIIEYENKMHNFSIEIPSTRTFQENINGFNIEVKTPKNDKINENLGIVVQELHTNETLSSFTENTIKGLKELYEDYNEIKKEDIEINLIKGTALTYEISGNGYEIKAQQTVFLKDNKSYIFQYTATKDTFNDYINEINKIINSFTILI